MTDLEFLKERDNIDVEWRQLILNREEQNYDISNIGTIRNHETKEEYKLSKIPGMKNSYEFVTLTLNDGKNIKIGIHRLIGMMFIPIPKKYVKAGIPLSQLIVDHIDDIKYHNIYTNLQWLTNGESLSKYYENPLNVRSSFIPAEDVKKICKDLSEGETIYNIAKRYDYNEDAIYKIKYRINYTEISKNYSFPTKRISEEDVIKVCELIMVNKTFEEISLITGISLSTISHISSGSSWTHISKNYKFPNRKKMTSEKYELIVKICEMLSNGKSPKQVSEELEVSKSFVQHIASREYYTDISKDYIFNYGKCKVEDETVHNICKDLESKNYTNKEIAERNGISTSFVKNIKSRKHRYDISKNYSW